MGALFYQFNEKYMVYKISWGLALIFAGLMIAGLAIPYLAILTGLALVVAGFAFIAGV